MPGGDRGFYRRVDRQHAGALGTVIQVDDCTLCITAADGTALVGDSSAGNFFFQAEDGIRDAQESRGLGDVYKRQDYWGI